MKKLLIAIISTVCLISCTISYKFNGTVINYDIIKTIAVKDFTNQAPMVYAPLASTFNEALKDIYTKQTRLTLVEANGDLDIEGEIVGYDIAPMAITSNASSAETRLTLKIRVRYTNNTNHEEDFERTYSAYRNFDSAQLITDVQDTLIEELVEEICDHIYNDTVANW
jgi:hypothetical protein